MRKLGSSRAECVRRIEGALKGLTHFVTVRNPQISVEIRRSIAEDDLVAVHTHQRHAPEERGLAIAEIFRLQNGRIVEHWDVIEEVPAESKNGNTMF